MLLRWERIVVVGTSAGGTRWSTRTAFNFAPSPFHVYPLVFLIADESVNTFGYIPPPWAQHLPPRNAIFWHPSVSHNRPTHPTCWLNTIQITTIIHSYLHHVSNIHHGICVHSYNLEFCNARSHLRTKRWLRRTIHDRTESK